MTTSNRTPESAAPSRTRTEVIGDRSVAVPNHLRPVRAVVGAIGSILLLVACGSSESTEVGSGAVPPTVPTVAPVEQVGEPLVVGTFDATRMPDPQCSPRADGEPGIDVERPVSLEEGLRFAIRDWDLPQELLHVPNLAGARQRVYVALHDDEVAAVVRMTLFDGDDGETQAWVAERTIRCVQLLNS